MLKININKNDIKELVSECIKRIISETNDFGLNIKGDLTPDASSLLNGFENLYI